MKLRALIWLGSAIALVLALAGCKSQAAPLPPSAGPPKAPTVLISVPTPAPNSPTATSQAPLRGIAVTAPSPAPPKSQLGKLAFVKNGDIWTENLPNGTATQLTRDGQDSEPSWSPSGEWLAFRKAGQQLWVIRSSGTDAHPVEMHALGPFAWSPVADRLAYLAHGGLFTIAADGSNRLTLVAPNSPPGTGVSSFAWSPDGQWLVYAQTRILQKAESGKPPVRFASIARIRLDGRDGSEILDAGRPSTFGLIVASWSPDGSWILYWTDPDFSASLQADGLPLMAAPVTGGIPVEVTKAMLVVPDFLAWSPSGRRLAIVDGGDRLTWTNKFIAVVHLPASLRRITGPSQAALYPAWSPDGQSIAFSSGPAAGNAGGEPAQHAMAQRRIWVMASDASNRHPLTNDPNFRDERPEWSADGAWILFARLHASQAQLWLMRTDGSDQKQVVDNLSLSPAAFGYYGVRGWGGLYDWWQGRGTVSAVGSKATRRSQR